MNTRCLHNQKKKKKKTKVKSGEKTWLVRYSGKEVVQRGVHIVLRERTKTQVYPDVHVPGSLKTLNLIQV